MIIHRIIVVVALLGLNACTMNTVAGLSYTPPASIEMAAVPLVGSVSAVDQRKEAPNRLATILGLYGQPIYTFDTTKPVKDEVADAFTQGLRARGMLAGEGAPLRMVLTIRKFDADMIYGSTARIDMTVAVLNGVGQAVFEQTIVDSTSDFAIFKVGFYADINDLKRMCQLVLDRSINKVLDDPRFRAVLKPVS